ncbi:MAG: peptidoglycan DD-metalloendopeptidase family protein [Rikenellaceae bacterium]|nr:peptidoglycan DD-metalloendopeptidase family protein [Rikenellaceae bacterium]
MYKKILIIITAGLVFAGCSKKTYSSRSVDPSPEYILTTPITYEDPFRTDRNGNQQKEIDVIKSEIKEIKRQNYPKITFTSKDTEHVSIANYDPFTEVKEIVLNLSEMKREFYFPYKGKFLSGYGMRGGSMHTGVDIKAIPNDTIKSILPGVVRMSKYYSGYGNIVVIRHYNGVESVYSHNSKNLVKPNDIVQAGTPIALAGRTGRATTEHLHFELRVMGQHFDPTLVIDTENHTLRDGVVTITKNSGGKIVASSSTRKSSTVSTTTLASQNSTPQSDSATTTSSAKVSGKTHKIKKGDTLYALSRRYNVSINQLCQLNGISTNTILRVGDVLKVK